MNDVLASFEAICMEFADAFRGRLKWKWDGRFNAVLAAFQTEDQEAVKSFLERQLNTIWNNTNSETAPDIVQDAISHFGGLMPGQLLFTSDPEDGILLCCAWWLWGNGETVSIRMALFPKSLSEEKDALLKEKFRGWFRA